MFRVSGVEIPDKPLYFVAEVIGILMETQNISESAARCRIYRRINNGSIAVKRMVGPTRIPRETLIDMLELEGGLT